MDLLEEIQKQLKKRQWGEAIRLEIEDNVDKRLLKSSEKSYPSTARIYLESTVPGSDLPYEEMYGLKVLICLRHPQIQPVPALMNGG